MIKMVALDLDGTIVNDHLKISSRVLSVLKHLIHDLQVRVVIATGRMFPSALPFAREIGICEPLVTYQGAMIRNLDASHSYRLHTPIQLGLARELMEKLMADGYHVNLYMNDTIWTRRHPQYTDFYTKTSGVDPVFHDDLLGCLDTPPTKMMVIDDHRVETLLEDLNRHYAGRLSFCRSRSNFCEIIDAGVSKWNALKLLADEWGIRPEEVMAIGDQGNDISMITHAGVGVAMGNAPDDVKQFANYVAPPIDQDGVAEAIERFVLGEMPLKSY